VLASKAGHSDVANLIAAGGSSAGRHNLPTQQPARKHDDSTTYTYDQLRVGQYLSLSTILIRSLHWEYVSWYHVPQRCSIPKMRRSTLALMCRLFISRWKDLHSHVQASVLETERLKIEVHVCRVDTRHHRLLILQLPQCHQHLECLTTLQAKQVRVGLHLSSEGDQHRTALCFARVMFLALDAGSVTSWECMVDKYVWTLLADMANPICFIAAGSQSTYRAIANEMRL